MKIKSISLINVEIIALLYSWLKLQCFLYNIINTTTFVVYVSMSFSIITDIKCVNSTIILQRIWSNNIISSDMKYIWFLIYILWSWKWFCISFLKLLCHNVDYISWHEGTYEHCLITSTIMGESVIAKIHYILNKSAKKRI